MFPKFMCIFTHRHSRGWHGDWGGKNKWERGASLITFVAFMGEFLEQDVGSF